MNNVCYYFGKILTAWLEYWGNLEHKSNTENWGNTEHTSNIEIDLLFQVGIDHKKCIALNREGDVESIGQ